MTRYIQVLVKTDFTIIAPELSKARKLDCDATEDHSTWAAAADFCKPGSQSNLVNL